MSNPFTMIRTAAETAFIERFAAENATLPGEASVRQAAFARFEAKGIPSRRVESYHYTDLRNILRQLAPAAPAATGKAGIAFDGVAHQLTFINGRFTGGDAPSGVSVIALADELAKGGALNAGFGTEGDVVVDLNTALSRDGVVLRVGAGVTVEQPLHLAFVDLASGAHYTSPRVVIALGAGASLTLIESAEGPDGIAYQTNAVVEAALGDGARLDHVRLNKAGDQALLLTTFAAKLGAGAEVSSLGMTLGAQTSRHQVFVTYAGEGAKAAIRGATLIRANQHHDTTLVVDHAVPGGESRELFKTVVDGSAQGVFQGKIIVRPDAQKTDGQMASNALLLSDDAGMSNKPELEIFADDVVCAHGATCGALDDNQLFYLMARGLPRKEAEALLVEAFIGEALDTLEHEGVREHLRALANDWLSERKRA